MRKGVIAAFAVLIFLSIAAIAFVVYYYLYPDSTRGAAVNVDDGGYAQAIDVNPNQCSTQNAAQCDCERAAVASGMSVRAARAACAN